MNIREGQIYEGTVSIAGTPDETLRRWIVVAPFGKTHIHSLSEAGALHCWPISVIINGLEQGNVRLVDEAPDHPILQLQRAKESHGIVDTHLGLNEKRLEQMLALLQRAANENASYTRHTAAEILSLLDPSALGNDKVQQAHDKVQRLLRSWQERNAPAGQ